MKILTERHDRPASLPLAIEAGLLAALFLGAGFLRLYNLTEVPLGLCLDEVMNGSLGRDVLNGRWEIYFEEAYGHEPLYHYLQAITIRFLGFNALGIRIPSVFCGMLLLLAVWWLARRLFGPWTALVTVGGLASGWWGVFYSRVGIRAVTSPLLLVASLIGFWEGMQRSGRGRWLAFGLGGAALGLSLYTYPAARAVVWLLPLVALHLLLYDRHTFRSRARALLVFALIALLVAAPIVVYLSTHREERVGQLTEPLQKLRQGDVSLVWPLARDTLLMPLGLRGDPRYLYNLSGRPIWGPIWAALFLGGLALALWRWRRPAYAMLPVWLLLGLLPGMVTPDAPNTIRAIAALPAVYMLAGLPVGELAHRLRPPLARILLIGAVAAGTVGHGVATWRDMVRWAHDFEAQWRYQTPLFAAARVLDADPDDAPVCVSFPWYADLAVSSLEAALDRQDLETRWFLGDRSLLFPGGSADCRYLYTDSTRPDPALDAQWLEGGSLLRSEQERPDGRPFYRFYRLPEIDIQREAVEWARTSEMYVGETWEPSLLPPLVRWDDLVELVGYRWASEPGEPGEEMALLTMWRANGAGDPPLNLFAHLLDSGGQYVAGEDRLDVPAQTWQAGDLFVQVHRLPLPADLPPGDYWPEVGFYDRTDGVRLPVIRDGQAVADRVLLEPVQVHTR
ncbi:MAG: glycosyltransferase family 39 protein [Anaerolineae bacterium]|nr:glycosyltransferase family 39 protein [Anaerolineae bacterium]